VPAILLFRHGKSDWNAGDADDRRRPLADRGRRAARTMGQLLARSGQLPDSVLTSPALRAVQTLELAMEGGGWTCSVSSREDLYGGGTSGLLREIRREPPSTELLLVVGHEPTSSETASLLIGGGRVRMPTGALVRIDFDADIESWADVGPGAGSLSWLLVPRLFPPDAFDFAG
jgi:phosphohistidine phosphatase